MIYVGVFAVGCDGSIGSDLMNHTERSLHLILCSVKYYSLFLSSGGGNAQESPAKEAVSAPGQPLVPTKINCTRSAFQALPRNVIFLTH